MTEPIEQPEHGTVVPSYKGDVPEGHVFSGSLQMTMDGATFSDSDTGEELYGVFSVIPVGVVVRSRKSGREVRFSPGDLLALAEATGFQDPDRPFPQKNWPEGFSAKPRK